MKCLYLSVEKNPAVFELFRSLWRRHGIDGVRVDTMTEGIKKAMKIEQSTSNELCFIAIVSGDTNYLPQLKILSEETNAPILIATGSYCEIEHRDALNNGADYYGKYSDEPDDNIKFVLSVINSIENRDRKRKDPNKITISEDILIVDGYNKAFINDKVVLLTSAELKVFRYLTINRGFIVSHKQIYNQVKNHSPDESPPSSIYNIIKRLRRKLRDATRLEYIETVRDFGYRLK